MDDCKEEGSPGCMQLICKFYLPIILHPTGRRNFLSKVQDDGVPSSFVLGMTLARKKLLFPPQFLFFCFFTPLSLGRGVGGEVFSAL